MCSLLGIKVKRQRCADARSWSNSYALRNAIREAQSVGSGRSHRLQLVFIWYALAMMMPMYDGAFMRSDGANVNAMGGL